MAADCLVIIGIIRVNKKPHKQDQGKLSKSLIVSLCRKKKQKFHLSFVELVALEGWYGDPKKQFSNL